jgi:hypothetical protein
LIVRHLRVPDIAKYYSVIIAREDFVERSRMRQKKRSLSDDELSVSIRHACIHETWSHSQTKQTNKIQTYLGWAGTNDDTELRWWIDSEEGMVEEQQVGVIKQITTRF